MPRPRMLNPKMLPTPKTVNPKASLCGVEVATWGTHPNGGNGLAHHIDSSLFGGNVGHASISITFPADEKGKELIKQYCTIPIIPYEKRKISIPKAKQINGKFTASDEPAFEEEVYVVHFSWFPGKTGFYLKESLGEDNLKEREGVNMNWDPKWKEYIQPEERYHAGILESSKMTYAPLNIVHTRNLDENHKKIVNNKAEILNLSKQLRSLNILEDKIKDKELTDHAILSQVFFSRTENMLLDRFIPDWKQAESIDVILEHIKNKKSFIKASISNLEDEIRDINKLNSTDELTDENDDENDFEDAKDVYDEWYYAYDILSGLADPRSKDYVKPGASIPISEINGSTLDDAFKLAGLNWEDFLASKEIITHEEIVHLIGIASIKLTEAKHLLVDREIGLDMFEQGNYSHYYTTGHPPDGVTRLPLASETQGGMNVESMLKEMQNIAQHTSFDLNKKNCSYTVSKILEAGAENEHLKNQFRNRALGCIANPQMVSNNARDYLNELQTNPNPKNTIMLKLESFSPMERLGGWCIDKLFVSPSVTLLEKVLAGILIVPTGTYSAVKEGIKKMTRPLKSFNELQQFAKYANSHQHTGFKVAAAMGYIPGMIVTAPLAGIEYASKNLTKMLFTSKTKDTVNETLSVGNEDKSKNDIMEDLDIIFANLKALDQAIKQKGSPEKISDLTEIIKNNWLM